MCAYLGCQFNHKSKWQLFIIYYPNSNKQPKWIPFAGPFWTLGAHYMFVEASHCSSLFQLAHAHVQQVESEIGERKHCKIS